MNRLAAAWNAFGAFLLGLVVLVEQPLNHGPLGKVAALAFLVSALVALYGDRSDEGDG